MDFSQIKKIENGQLFFSDLDNERSIDLRKSAQICYEFFNKSTVVDKLFRKKEKNIYTGIKNFNIDGKAYITLFGENEKYIFEMDVNENNRSKQTEIWNYTNIKLNEQGFWLLDWH
jgi:hypothetical protein